MFKTTIVIRWDKTEKDAGYDDGEIAQMTGDVIMKGALKSIDGAREGKIVQAMTTYERKHIHEIPPQRGPGHD